MQPHSAPVSVAVDPLRGSSLASASVASSGAGLPSALLTPRDRTPLLDEDDPLLGPPPPQLPPPRSPLAPTAPAAAATAPQPFAPQPPRAPSPAPAAVGTVVPPPPRRAPLTPGRVRWADSPAGGSPPAVDGAAAAEVINACSSSQGADSADGTAAAAAAVATAAATAVAAAVGEPAPAPAQGVGAAVAARRAPLPDSGSAQLDKYLLYLLRGEHPHKFMYYPGWGLPDEACAAVGEFLRLDRRIKVATLSGNRIGDDGAELLAAGLAANRTVSALDLSDNRIGDAGALAIAQALSSGGGAALAELNLSNNRIGDEGAEALAAAAASCRQLKRLHLGGNGLSRGALKVVERAVTAREYRVPPHRQNSTSSIGSGGAAAAAGSGASAPADGRVSSSVSSFAAAAGSLLRRIQPHKRAPSVLQFDIELTDTDDALSKSAHLLRLQPEAVIASLCEPAGHLESSVGAQCAHAVAEAEAEAAAGGLDAAGWSPLRPGSLLLRLGLRLARLGYSVVVRCAAAPVAANAAAAAPAGGQGQQQGQEPQQAQQEPRHNGHDRSQQEPAAGPTDGQQQQQQQQQQGAAGAAAAAGRHAFLVVQQPGELSGPVVVDPDFAAQFALPAADARYQAAVAALPRVLVMQEARLFFLLEALCSEMSAAFEALGRPLPPWRSLDLVAAKWQPKRFTDIPIGDELAGDSGSGGGGAATAAAAVGAGSPAAVVGAEGPAIRELRQALTALGV